MRKKIIMLVLSLTVVLSAMAIFTATACTGNGDYVIIITISTPHLEVYAEMENGDPLYRNRRGEQIVFTWEIDTQALNAPAHSNVAIEVMRNGVLVHTILNAAENQAGAEFRHINNGDADFQFRIRIISFALISPTQARTMMNTLSDDQEDFVLLDVRNMNEFLEIRIEGATLIPYNDPNFAETARAQIPNKNTVILLYCRAGRRSTVASYALVRLGYTRVYDFGGLIYDTTLNALDPYTPNETQGIGWVGRGYPTVSGCIDECDCPPQDQTTCPFCNEEMDECSCHGRMLRFNFESDIGAGYGGWHGFVIIGLYDETGDKIELRAINGGVRDGGNLIGHIEIVGISLVSLRLRFEPFENDTYVLEIRIGKDGMPFMVQEGDGYVFVDIEINPLELYGFDIIDLTIRLEYD